MREPNADLDTGPFILTIFLSLAVILFMVIGSSQWLTTVMELTWMSWDYKLFLVGLGGLYLGAAWLFERHVAVPLSKAFGQMKVAATGKTKQRKQYKQIQSELRAAVM